MADFPTCKNQSKIDVLYARHCGGKRNNKKIMTARGSFLHKRFVVKKTKTKRKTKLPNIDNQHKV